MRKTPGNNTVASSLATSDGDVNSIQLNSRIPEKQTATSGYEDQKAQNRKRANFALRHSDLSRECQICELGSGAARGTRHEMRSKLVSKSKWVWNMHVARIKQLSHMKMRTPLGGATMKFSRFWGEVDIFNSSLSLRRDPPR